MIDAFEKISLVIHQNNKQASSAVAQEIADLIRQKAKEGKNLVMMNTQELAAGMYQLVMVSSNGQKTLPFIVK